MTGVAGEPLAVAVIGAGWMGHEHADSIQAAGDSVVAVVDRDVARAQELCSSCEPNSAPKPYSSITEMLELNARQQRPISAAVVSTPSAIHLEQVRELVEAGLAVLVEKPPWIVGQDPEPVLKLVAERGALAVVGMTTREEPGIRELRAAAQAGDFGRILSITDEIFFRLKPGELAAWYSSSPQAGGGVVMTNGVHSVDRTSWILGTGLQLSAVDLQRIGPRRNSEDYAELSLQAAGTASAVGAPETARVEISLLWSEYEPPPSRLQVIGTDGAGWADGSGHWTVRGLRGERSGKRAAGHSNHLQQWLSFRGLVNTGPGGTPTGSSAELATLADLKPVMDILASAVLGNGEHLQGFSRVRDRPDLPSRKLFEPEGTREHTSVTGTPEQEVIHGQTKENQQPGTR